MQKPPGPAGASLGSQTKTDSCGEGWAWEGRQASWVVLFWATLRCVCPAALSVRLGDLSARASLGLLLPAHSLGTFFPSSSLTFELSSSAPLPSGLKGTGWQAQGLPESRARSFPLFTRGHSVLSLKAIFWPEGEGSVAAICNRAGLGSHARALPQL